MHMFGGLVGWLLAVAVVLIPTFFVGRYAQTRPPFSRHLVPKAVLVE